MRERKSTDMQGILTPSMTIIFVLFCGIIEKNENREERRTQKKSESVCRFSMATDFSSD